MADDKSKEIKIPDFKSMNFGEFIEFDVDGKYDNVQDAWWDERARRFDKGYIADKTSHEELENWVENIDDRFSKLEKKFYKILKLLPEKVDISLNEYLKD